MEPLGAVTFVFREGGENIEGEGGEEQEEEVKGAFGRERDLKAEKVERTSLSKVSWGCEE